MRKGFFGFVLSPLPFAFSSVGALLFALCVVAKAQELKKVSRIGFLTNSSSFFPGRTRGLPAGAARAWVRRGEEHCH